MTNRSDGDLVRERLDKAVVTGSWRTIFNMAKLHVLETESSDHLLIFLALVVQIQKFVRQQFRFENSWIQEVDCKSIVEDGWRRSENMQLNERIDLRVKQLQVWAKNHHEDFRKRLR